MLKVSILTCMVYQMLIHKYIFVHTYTTHWRHFMEGYGACLKSTINPKIMARYYPMQISESRFQFRGNHATYDRYLYISDVEGMYFDPLDIFLYEQEFSSLNLTTIGEVTIILPTSTTTTTTSTTKSTTTSTTTDAQTTEIILSTLESWQSQFDDMFNATVICKLIN